MKPKGNNFPFAFCNALENDGITMLKATILWFLSSTNLMYSGLIKLMYFFLKYSFSLSVMATKEDREAYDSLNKSNILSTCGITSLVVLKFNGLNWYLLLTKSFAFSKNSGFTLEKGNLLSMYSFSVTYPNCSKWAA